MRLMKRIFYLAIIGVVLALLLAPLGFSTTNRGVSVVNSAALAATPAPAAKAPTCISGVKDGAQGCDILGAPACVQTALPVAPGDPSCVSNNPATGGAIINYLRGWLKLLSGAVGLVIVLVLIIAGIQYIVSTGDPAQIKAAKKRIQNAIIALVLFLMMYAILQFLVPGGIL
jgi:hypothetical protein